MLSQRRIEEIEAAAQRLKERHLDTSARPYPVNVYELARAEGFDVLSGDFKDKTTAGMYDRGSKRIYISKSDPYQRKAFTIAHELGHYELHRDMDTERFYRKQVEDPSSPSDIQEQEANWFAASLLMPRDLLYNMYVQLRGDEKSLAIMLGVSRQALNYRLENTRVRYA